MLKMQLNNKNKSVFSVIALYKDRNLKKVMKNISWLFFDRVLRLIVGIFVGIWLARYLGPSQFGLLSYANAFTALFGVFASLGLDRIVVRELVKNPHKKDELLGSVFIMKLIASVIVLISTTSAIYFIRNGETIILWLVALSSAGFIFQSINVIDLYYQAKVQSRLSIIAVNSAFFIMTITKIILLIYEAPLIAFGFVGLGEIILGGIFLVIVYSDKNSLFKWRYENTIVRELLKDSWPLILSGAAVMIYMRIDQIMIGEMLGDKELGLYSAAVKLSEVWYIMPSIIANSIYPSIIESKNKSIVIYNSRLQNLYDVMFIMALGVAIVVTLSSDWLVMLIFGDSFYNSSKVLAILIWAGIFIFFSSVWSCDVLSRNQQKIFLKYDLCSITINVMLNLILIPRYGIIGSALATSISVPITYMIMYIFIDSERQAMSCLIRSVLFISTLKNIKNSLTKA